MALEKVLGILGTESWTEYKYPISQAMCPCYVLTWADIPECVYWLGRVAEISYVYDVRNCFILTSYRNRNKAAIYTGKYWVGDFPHIFHESANDALHVTAPMTFGLVEMLPLSRPPTDCPLTETVTTVNEEDESSVEV